MATNLLSGNEAGATGILSAALFIAATAGVAGSLFLQVCTFQQHLVARSTIQIQNFRDSDATLSQKWLMLGGCWSDLCFTAS